MREIKYHVNPISIRPHPLSPFESGLRSQPERIWWTLIEVLLTVSFIPFSLPLVSNTHCAPTVCLTLYEALPLVWKTNLHQKLLFSLFHTRVAIFSINSTAFRGKRKSRVGHLTMRPLPFNCTKLLLLGTSLWQPFLRHQLLCDISIWTFTYSKDSLLKKKTSLKIKKLYWQSRETVHCSKGTCHQA